MTDQANPTQDHLLLNYESVSSVHADARGNQRVLLSTASTEQGSPRAAVRVRDTTLLREALSTFYMMVYRSYRYKASSPDTNTRYNEWRHKLKDASPGESRQLFYAFLRDQDPEAESILDPLVSIHPDGITFEAFDLDGRMYLSLEIARDGYEPLGEVSYGTTSFDMGPELLQTLQRLRASGGEGHLVIGAAPEEYPTDYQAKIDKSLHISDTWLRAVLQLQATLTLPGKRVHLSRMDLYNMLRHLRLNKTQRGDRKAIRLALMPGGQPEMTLEPWEWTHTCTSDAYEGPRSEVIRLWDREDLFALDRMLPYLEGAEVHTCGEALPNFWVLRCGAVTLTVGSSGFRRRNWPRGMLLDLDLPRAPRSAAPSSSGGVQGKKFLFTGTLASMKRKDAQTQVQGAGGSTPSAVVKDLDYLVIGDADLKKFEGGWRSAKLKKAETLQSKGSPLKIIGESQFLSLFATSSAPQSAPSPNTAATTAALSSDGQRRTEPDLTEASGLESVTLREVLRQLSQDGAVVYDLAKGGYRTRPLPVDDARLARLVHRNDREARAHELIEDRALTISSKWLPSGEVEVNAQAIDSAQNAAVYEPSFLLKADGALRRPKCTCSFSLRPENKGLPCEHIMALWVGYQKQRQQLDPNQLEVDHSTLIKRRPQGVEVHEVSLKNRRLEETKEVRGSAGKNRQSILLFPDVAAARDAYFKRVEYLKNHGYLDAGRS